MTATQWDKKHKRDELFRALATARQFGNKQAERAILAILNK